ncbi:hypothetical protein ACFE04_006945 [Oxalis oulophora]
MMNQLESVVTQIQGLSGSRSDVASLHTLLKQNDELLQAESAQLLPLLLQLDPSKHSLGYLFLLEASTTGPFTRARAEIVVPIMATFITSSSADQIRLAPDKFVSICNRLKDQVLLLDAPMRGVAPLLSAVRKLPLSSERLTALHPEFLQLCLLSKCYKAGFSILEDDIFEVDQPRDLYLFCYYGGMICIGLKRFQKALDLLHNFSSLPKYTSNVAMRTLKNFCQAYHELGNIYSTGKIAELETFLQAQEEKFESDKNLGLVKQVLSSMYKRNIQRLTQTYLTLSLQDIANIVQLNSPKEAEMRVLQMIEDGEIYATINQKDGMVRFLEDPEQYKTCAMIEHIDSSIQRIMLLSKKLTATDEALSCDPLYLSKVGRERQRLDFDDFDAVPQKFNI